MKKRVFSWFLCLAMLLSLMPTGILALAGDAAQAAEILDGRYYENGTLKKGAGLVQVEDALYYVTSTGAVKTGRYALKDNAALGIQKGIYYFFKDGKLNTARGVYDGQYYNDQGISEPYVGLVEWNGAKYSVGDSGKVKVGRHFLTKLNGILPTKRAYTFFEDGRMLEDTRIHTDGYYYENGIRTPYAGLVTFGGYWYYVVDNGAYATNAQQVLVNVNDSGLAKNGRAYFGADGRMVTNTAVNGVYYGTDGVAPSYAGVVKAADGNFYFVNGTHGKLAVNKTVTVSTKKANGLLAAGEYVANALGVLSPVGGTVTVTPADGKVPAGGVTVYGDGVSAFVPEGVLLANGADKLTLIVTPLKNTDGDITAGADEMLIPVDVHIEGVAADNTVPILIELGEVLPRHLNLGNYRLYHVEDGVTTAMTLVNDKADLAAHNQFTYDPLTGEVTLAMATFSEVALVSETDGKWEGNMATSFSDGSGTEDDPYLIANADQLAFLNDRISNDNENYGDKHYKLMADIDLNDAEDANKDWLFYPIGYLAKGEGTNKAGEEEWYTYGGAFRGVFDGNGHTIANFYQNTWEMDGDYDYGYWDAAMGLFGYVYGGTVKNLTVDNFSSDGEYTPTGVIAAYAVNATFENIAITNCNPRVYNTGNGGIVGIGGNTSDTADAKLIFKNITIDNTNKITALWGSWDVACGGLVGMFRGAGYVHMTNCHVAAQIDVFNDVCGNYQYYWYRYSGMMIGTNKNMITDKDGYTVPETDKFLAKNCTVHFGDWNDYYYCELVANSLASYTHDHQFSRLEQITSLDEIKSGETWTKTGNFLLISGDTKTCYHIVNKDGVLTQHKHDDAGTEVVNGETVLKENNQIVYLPFNQLFTGYGWGVKHVPIYDDGKTYFEGITILDREIANSVKKFEKVTQVETYPSGYTVNLGDLFAAKEVEDEDDVVEIVNDKVQVFVSPADTSSTARGTYTPNATDWTKGTLTFTGNGKARITITDYYFCTETTFEVEVKEGYKIEEFKTVFPNTEKYTYRVGNANPVALKSLFKKAYDGVSIYDEKVEVTIESVSGNAAGAYTKNATWTNGTIQFTGTGVVEVTIKDCDYGKEADLTLEVVEATNATGAMSATKNNVVLLNDANFSSLEVSGGYTLYGNGFTLTCASDSAALDMGYSFVTLNNGTLDNVQIVCPNFDYAVLYKSNMTESGNRKEETDRVRYFNVKSGVMVSGNSQILNSRISGARAAVNVSGGNCVIDNSRIEGGAVASLLVGAANSLTLRDVTLIQKPTESTYKKDGAEKGTTLMGFSVLYMCDSEGKATPTTLEGTLVQQAWVNADDKKYVPSAGQDIVDGVMKETAFIHNINGKDSLNLGFAYMPEDVQNEVKAPDNIEDNRTNKATVPYEMKDVKIQISILATTVYVYSYKNTNGTDASFINVATYIPNKYGDNITVTYSDTADGLENGKSFGTDGWVYELNVDLDKLPGYALDFSKLSMSINGTTVTDFKVNGNAKPASPVEVTAGGVTYTLTATVNGKEYTATYKVTGTETSKDSPSLVASNYAAGLCVASSYGGTWSGAAPALEGIQIRYWSVAEKQYKTIDLSDYTPTTKGQLNGANTTWTYSPANGDFTLTLTGGQVHSSNNVYAMPVCVDTDGNGAGDTLYFVAAKSSGLVNSGNSARSVPVSYTFKDNNNGDVLTFSHSWSVAENKNDQYKYSDFCNGTKTKLEDNGCVTPDTLVTLADGTQKRIDEVTYTDQLLVWDFHSGKYVAMPSVVIRNHGDGIYRVLKLEFSDGTTVDVIEEHGFFDEKLNEFVMIGEENVAEYIGHRFVKSADSGDAITLVNFSVREEYTTAYSILTAAHYNCVLADMLTLTPNVISGNYFMPFTVGDNMQFDEAAKQADIEKYGLFTYEEFAGLVTEEQFYALNAPQVKVAVGKGIITMEQLYAIIEELIPRD